MGAGSGDNDAAMVKASEGGKAASGGEALRDASSNSRSRLLILGLGNLLLSDEGIGCQVIEHLNKRYEWSPEVALCDGGTCGMELVETIDGHDDLIIIDAVRTDVAPGHVSRFDGGFPMEFRDRLSPHQIGLPDVMAALRLLDIAPRRVTVIGVEPASIELGVELSPIVAAAFPAVIDLVIAELTSRGVTIRPLP